MDKVFKALADETRRYLLDRLREENGQTLGELCARLGMARQSVTQHLGVLEAANLITTVRRGREKLHYLNPVPLHDIQQRWIDRFEQPRLRVLSEIKRQAEASMKPEFVYVTYIQSTPEKVWEALTDADLTAAYWAHSNVSDWQEGSTWEHRRADGSGIADVVGEVVTSEPPHRLVTTWRFPEGGGDVSTVTYAIKSHDGVVRLTVTHVGLADETAFSEISQGWPAVLSNLKSFLETGSALPTAPWEVPVG
ncbi:metalloregulator ArsR/SmtB family transcription factor [Actinosynnema sp. NPDC047251]|uniref:Transcriptional regulator, ArsR family n=1 Tax=Saccharothrix espanaensis (strain ATCC 51144 / DSM 44229 / JCM 9112 / NBRC 15066 / NRRL 15764) TaxID=1179773 RepID=K0KG64_SACES|nr:metalloregulator ArsR/SmtB family transcription factor [Saccharothrix espanaensis]CCH35749.1 Transcriptional regulator, ArsR family [Saccharothrix espanaensis DSM 44229]